MTLSRSQPGREFSWQAASQLDVFTFSDAPVFEKLSLLRTEVSRLMRLATICTTHGTRAVRIDASGILVTTIAELGQCRNRCAAEKAA